jgi:hypothetical protein
MVGQKERVTFHNEDNGNSAATEYIAYKKGEFCSGCTRLEAFTGQIMNRR